MCFKAEIYHPAFGSLQTDGPVRVHCGFEEFPGPQIPEEQESDPCADSENVTLEAHRTDATPVISARNLLNGLEEEQNTVMNNP